MREITLKEITSISGASERITPKNRWFTNEYNIDADGAFMDYMHEHYGDAPGINLVSALPGPLYRDMAELYYRSVSYEDAFWWYGKAGIGGASCMLVGLMLGRFGL